MIYFKVLNLDRLFIVFDNKEYMIYDYMNQNIIVRNKINMNGGFEINRNVVFEYSDNELLMIINCKYY